MRIEHGLLPGHVLQRTPKGAAATITGACSDPGCACPVTATVRKGAKPLPGFKDRRIGASDGGRFSVRLAGLPTGGPYTVELACGRERVAVKDVFVGDLWLMAGQSNMEGVGNICDADTPHPLVRNFSMARRWELAKDPLHYLAESPDKVHGGGPADPALIARGKRLAGKGVGVGVPFGKLMHARTKVPQGLIATAHGGTSMAQWDPALKDKGGDSLYGSMWLSLQAVGQPVAGMLWYQGCSETHPAAAEVYTARMQDLVAAVRRDLGQPRLPWVIVQIGRVVEKRADPSAWNSVQEQQRLLPTVIPHCDVVPAVDLALDDLIHIAGSAFPELAQRMARVAARLVHGDRREKPAIQPKAVRFHDPKPPFGPAVEVGFANVVGGLRTAGLPQGFSIINRDGQPVECIYRTVVEGGSARLYLTGTAVPGMRVMYGYGTNPVCNAVDGRGMAVPVFGPLPVPGLPGITDWFMRWKVTPILPGEDIAGLAMPDPQDPGLEDRVFTTGNFFVNRHDEWLGHAGHAAFHGHVDAPEAMEVELRTGYDGPFRLWVDGREVHTDLGGTNPAIQDARRIKLKLAAGSHPISVLMGLNGGRAWGFFMRMARLGSKGRPAVDLPLPTPWK